jgi:hypothetical protein
MVSNALKKEIIIHIGTQANGGISLSLPTTPIGATSIKLNPKTLSPRDTAKIPPTQESKLNPTTLQLADKPLDMNG